MRDKILGFAKRGNTTESDNSIKTRENRKKGGRGSNE